MAQLTATLLYYDGVQVFEGSDDSGNCYLGALIDSAPDADRYLVTRVLPEQLRELRAGACDLRAALLEGSYSAWYLACVNDNFATPFALERQQSMLLDHDYLPENGVLLAGDGIDNDVEFQQPLSEVIWRNPVD